VQVPYEQTPDPAWGHVRSFNHARLQALANAFTTQSPYSYSVEIKDAGAEAGSLIIAKTQGIPVDHKPAKYYSGRLVSPMSFVSCDYNRQVFDELFSSIATESQGQVRSVVDAGSGLGFNLAMLHKHFPQARVSAIDVSEDALALSQRLPDAQAVEQAREELVGTLGFKHSWVDALKRSRLEQGFIPGQVEFVTADLHNLRQIPSGSIDLILLSEVIEHVERPQELLNELHRILSDNGRVVISFPNYFNVAGIVKLVQDHRFGRRCWDPYGSHKEGRENLFTSFSLKHLLRSKGLT